MLVVATAVLQIAVYALQYIVVLRLDVPVLTTAAIAIPKWFFVTHLFWFALGVILGLRREAIVPVLRRLRWILPLGAVGFFVLGILEWELLLRWSGHPWTDTRVTLVDGLYSVTIIMWALAFSDVEWPLAPSLVTLGAHSYGIYLTHSLVMGYMSRGLYHFAPVILAHQTLLQPLLITVGIGTPLLLMMLGRRTPSRGFYSYVFG
jgi:peptidoglycan/LPS O-acetylase OafA/YrhL